MGNVVRLLSTLALRGALVELAGQYQAKTAVTLDADYAPTVGLLKRLREGEQADVLILTREGLDELLAEGAVVASSRIDLARSYVGLAVKVGDPHPDISTEAAFVAALLKARSVAYSRSGASGIYFAELIQRLGIAAAVNARATITTGFTAERLIRGDADLAVQQLSELKQVAGVELVGPIPLSLQTAAIFTGGRMAASANAAAADALLKYLASPEVAPLLCESGLEV
ncbi:MAG: substrate-binding domain-containing protein [Bradyrhizobium sp.]|nr:substrate-binding domain-containing protein [Bradyrhizobium sp.]